MPRVLLVDTNVSSAPIHDHLLREGCEVFVAGANPRDFLAKTSRHHLDLDYGNLDQLRAGIDALKFDYIVPGCNDRSYQVCSVLAQELGYPGIDTPAATDAINSKEQFRAVARHLGLPVPRVYPRADVPAQEALIVKPVDAYSGRGVTIVAAGARGELDAAVERAQSFSRSRQYLIEEFVTGQLYSHTAFIAAGRVWADFIVEEHCTANPFVVDTSRVVFDCSPEMLQSLRANVATLARKLALVDGLMHTQFIRRGDQYWLIEITRRCPGDLYSRLIELSTGFRYVENYVRPFLGAQGPSALNPLQPAWIMRHTVSRAEDGRFGAIGFKVPILIEALVPLIATGDELKGSPHGRACLLFTRSESKEALERLFALTVRRELYSIRASI